MAKCIIGVEGMQFCSLILWTKNLKHSLKIKAYGVFKNNSRTGMECGIPMKLLISFNQKIKFASFTAKSPYFLKALP